MAAKDSFKQALGFIDRAIERAGTYDDMADNFARGDSASAARFRGRADAEAGRAAKTIENQTKKVR